MKKVYFLLLGLFACSFLAVGSANSHVIEKSAIYQVSDQKQVTILPVAEFSAELPIEFSLLAYDFENPIQEFPAVSAGLAEGFLISIRPPPDSKVENLVYKEFDVGNTI